MNWQTKQEFYNAVEDGMFHMENWRKSDANMYMNMIDWLILYSCNICDIDGEIYMHDLLCCMQL